MNSNRITLPKNFDPSKIITYGPWKVNRDWIEQCIVEEIGPTLGMHKST